MSESGNTSNIISPKIYKSVVKIFVIHCSPFYYQPWEMNMTRQTTSSGFILSFTNREILCNAHSVAHAASIRIRKYGESKKYNACIKYIGHDWDLAVLTIKDDKFWQNTDKIELHDITPSLQDTITVLGYPTGGDDLSVTKGVVSRIGFVIYDHPLQYLLAIQIDAAINPGNSGGPCLNIDGNVVGVAFQIQNEADNVGYCIPIRVVHHFIKSKTTNINYKIPDLGVDAVHIENYSLKQYLKMIGNNTKKCIKSNDNDSKYDEDIDSIEIEKEMEGILITDIDPFTDAMDKLKKHDVILQTDGIPVGDDGTIKYGKNSRIHWNYVISNKLEGQSVKLKILRDGKILDIDVMLKAMDAICPVTLYDAEIEYFIFGGLVFLPLSRPYLQSKFGADTWSQICPTSLKYAYLYQKKEYIDEQIIILSQVLPSETTVGYHDANNMILKTINGQKVKNIKDLANTVDLLIENSDNHQFITFEFESHDIIVLNINEAINSIQSILDTHKIGYDRSPNLRKITDEMDEIDEEIDIIEFDNDEDININATELVYNEENDTYSITLESDEGGVMTIDIPTQCLKTNNNVTTMIDNLINEIEENAD